MQQFALKCLRSVIYSNAFIAFNAAFLTHVSLILDSNRIPDFRISILVFLATWLVYNLHRLAKHEYIFYRNQKHYPQPLFSIYGNVLITAATLIGITFLGVQLISPKTLLSTSPLIILALLYSAKILKINKKTVAIRELPFAKIFLIAFSWAFITYSLPVHLQSQKPLLELLDTHFLMRFIFIFSITIPFDIRDLKYDTDEQKTIPSVIGTQNALHLSRFLFFGFLLISLWVDYQLFFCLLPLSIFALYLISICKNKGDLFFTGLMDGLILLKGLSIGGYLFFLS